MKLIKILLTISVIIGISNQIYAANPADSIVESAYNYVHPDSPDPYISGQPSNKDTDLGGIFDLASWNESDGFDCSELVSWAGGLRLSCYF